MGLTISEVETVQTFACHDASCAAAASSEYPLSEFERHSMEAIRLTLQRHLDSLGLTAAVDPTEMVTQEMINDFLDLADSLWFDLDLLMDGFTLDTLPLSAFQELVNSAIESARNKYVDTLKSLIGKSADTPVYGEVFFADDYEPGTGTKPPEMYQVQYGDVREVLHELGGGADGGDLPLSTGMTGGRVLGEVLAANGLATNEKLWLYGENARRTFNGHLQMDGLVFTEWDDPALEISPQDQWLRTQFYRPGDHWGCACVVVPYVPNFGAALTTVITSSAAGFNPGQPRDREGRWTAHKGRITSLSVESIERVHGAGLTRLFPNGASTATTPWPRAPRLKTGKLFDQSLVDAELRRPAQTEKIDPRILFSTQPSLVRHHVEYYLGDQYHKTGQTSADHENPANKLPIVYVKRTGEHLILTGHHRAAKALITGEDLEARVVREGAVTASAVETIQTFAC